MNKIYVYFLLFCFPMRIVLAYLAYKLQNTKYINYYVFLILFMGLSFLYQYLLNYRKIGAFGQKVWWHNYRIIHALNYLTYCFIIYRNDFYSQYAYRLLVLDALLGLAFFINNHFI